MTTPPSEMPFIDFEFTPPEHVTGSLMVFFARWHQIRGLMTWIFNVVGAVDELRKRAAEHGVDLSGTHTQQGYTGKDAEFLRDYHAEVLFSMLLVEHVNNYLTFVAALMREIIEHKPEAAGNGEVTVSDVLAHDSMAEFRRWFADKKVDDLSRKSHRDLSKWFASRGVALVATKDDETRLNEVIALRNIVVHNGGRIDERAARDLGATQQDLGEHRPIRVRDLDLYTPLLARHAVALHERASKHFELETVPFEIVAQQAVLMEAEKREKAD